MAIPFTLPAQTGPDSQAPLAWRIEDANSAIGYRYYRVTLEEDRVAAVMASDWILTLVGALEPDGTGIPCHSLAFGDGTTRFYAFIWQDGENRIWARLLGDTTGDYLLTETPDVPSAYRTYALTFDPAVGEATFWFDDHPVASWAGQSSDGQAREVMWGANSSSGQGTMNTHRVEFSVPGWEVMARYEAGAVDGGGAAAPHPETQGWTEVAAGNMPTAASHVASTTLPLFTMIHGALPAISSSDVLWVDTDNDGLVELFVAGNAGEVFDFDGSDFIPGPQLSTSRLRHAVAFDYDRDGRLDLLAGDRPRVLLNKEAGWAEEEIPMVRIDGNGHRSLGDLNQDGRPDLFLTYVNEEAGNEPAEIWTYAADDAPGPFQRSAVILPSYSNGSMSPFDYDLDGDLDFVVSAGTDPGTAAGETTVWTNRGGLDFVSGEPFLVDRSYFTHVEWADFNRDGRPDFVVNSSRYPTVAVFLQEPDGSFVEQSYAVPATDSQFAVGDLNNDGWTDLLLVGNRSSVGIILEAWLNDGDGFTLVPLGLPGVRFQQVSLGDYDGDGDLDVALTGRDATLHFRTFVLRNNTATPNTVPRAPENLSSLVEDNRVTLTWEAASDAETATPALTYNVRVRQARSDPGETEVPSSSLGDGTRQIAASGNAGQRLFSSYVLPPGDYEWSVQAVDTSFAGSAFAAAGGFSIAQQVFPQWFPREGLRLVFTGRAPGAYEVLRYPDLERARDGATPLGPAHYIAPGLYELWDPARPPEAPAFYEVVAD
ncbi:MAG: FG-GAP-like repeat-containing protein [Opitutales bacterium]